MADLSHTATHVNVLDGIVRGPEARDWRVHPGELLQETLDERGMSQSYLAFATGYTPKHINQIVKGHASITATVAVRLERELGIEAEFWMRCQMAYDLHAAREKEAARV